MATQPAIMIQGTASNSGKSLLAAGLCRVFRQDGLRAAPFKSQNMALNSYVTDAGLEMGRAQVMQAECAGTRPDVRMNPILLKPTGERRSQVIVRGEVAGEMDAREYYAHRTALIPVVREAYESLAADYDVIVLEGAGSPAEINLKENDIVNMGMAKIARAPVLLVGDIDRGGVFASLAGTRLLLEPEERAMLRGVVINKFRGDKQLLDPGIAMLEELMECPVLGVVPWLDDLDVDDEDSLSGRLRAHSGGVVDVAVLRFPRLSNFTDFVQMGRLPGVGVRYVSAPRQMGAPDMLILPGTKSTMADLLWLRECGLDQCVAEQARRGIPVFGVCGGYQMLGRTLRDPHGSELGGELPGLGLLPCETTFLPQKRRALVRGHFGPVEGPLAALAGTSFSGYEIHTGQTNPEGAGGLCVLEPAGGENGLSAPGPEREDGMCRGNVYGAYVHGIFDSAAVSEGIVRALYAAKGLDAGELCAEDAERHKERQYDRLAGALRKSLDIKRIYDIVDKGL